MVKHPVKPKRKKVQPAKKAEVKIETKKDHPKKNPWQPIDTAPSNELVYIQVGGELHAAILDGHWYASVDGKLQPDKIIYNPTHWMPFPKE